MDTALLYARWGQSASNPGPESDRLYLQAKSQNADDPEVVYKLAGNSKSLETLAKLQKKGHDIDATGAHGLNALSLALRRNDLVVIGNLLSIGADPNKVLDDNGSTPFIMAIAQSSPNVVASFLKYGADTHSRWRDIPIREIARQRGNSNIVKLIDQE